MKLEDGSYNFVFIKKFDDYNKAYWRCNICDVAVGGALEKHVMGRKHQTCLGLSSHPIQFWGKQAPPKPRYGMGDLRLAPGEPVPPGFEDEVCRICIKCQHKYKDIIVNIKTPFFIIVNVSLYILCLCLTLQVLDVCLITVIIIS